MNFPLNKNGGWLGLRSQKAPRYLIIAPLALIQISGATLNSHRVRTLDVILNSVKAAYDLIAKLG